jgi:DNA-binding transcriptional MerR regulator
MAAEEGVPMADTAAQEKEPLQPVEPAELLKNLRLTTGKAAQFCGVSRRQLCYWTDTGIISSLEGDDGDSEESARRTYDFDALHRVLLIKQALEQSGGLRRAAREVERYLSQRRRRAEELAASIEQKREEFLTEQAERLEALASQVQQTLPRLQDREHLLELHRGLEWLHKMTERVQAGEVLLEEDAQACLRLVSLLEQSEAKLDGLSPAP